MHSNYSPPFSPQAEQLSSDLERASISFEGSCDCLGRPLTNNAAAAASVKGGRRQLSSIVCPRFRLCGLAAARLHETWTPSLALISGWTLPRVRYSCAFQLFLTRASFSVHLSAAAEAASKPHYNAFTAAGQHRPSCPPAGRIISFLTFKGLRGTLTVPSFRQTPKRAFNIMMSGQFCTFAMFLEQS